LAARASSSRPSSSSGRRVMSTLSVLWLLSKSTYTRTAGQKLDACKYLYMQKARGHNWSHINTLHKQERIICKKMTKYWMWTVFIQLRTLHPPTRQSTFQPLQNQQILWIEERKTTGPHNRDETNLLYSCFVACRKNIPEYTTKFQGQGLFYKQLFADW
jgi:hypothetical protein